MVRYVIEKRPLTEGRSGSFVKMLSINEALFAVILVGCAISGKNILEYNKSKKSLVAL